MHKVDDTEREVHSAHHQHLAEHPPAPPARSEDSVPLPEQQARSANPPKPTRLAALALVHSAQAPPARSVQAPEQVHLVKPRLRHLLSVAAQPGHLVREPRAVALGRPPQRVGSDKVQERVLLAKNPVLSLLAEDLEVLLPPVGLAALLARQARLVHQVPLALPSERKQLLLRRAHGVGSVQAHNSLEVDSAQPHNPRRINPHSVDLERRHRLRLPDSVDSDKSQLRDLGLDSALPPALAQPQVQRAV